MSLPREDNPSSDNGNDFTYNFISDLGPLLALFGERVAQQFMSQSMGWADNIIFAMGPLGIITAIVAAIRVGGPSWLKAIIGRARENRANAEVELMSSTSHEVCELWNGQQIVRILGSPEVKELIYISGAVPAPDGRGILNFYTLDQAEKDKQVEVVDESNHIQRQFRRLIRKIRAIIPKHKARIETSEAPATTLGSEPALESETASAPNISLNIHKRRGRGELHAVATIGTILQFGVLVYAAFATYHPHLKLQGGGSGFGRASYAFPLTLVGTLFLVAGMSVCSHVIERSTEEKNYRVKLGADAHILWLQKVATVGDQEFSSYAIFAEHKRNLITTSRRNNQNDPTGPDQGGGSFSSEFFTIVGTIVSLCGFFAQFLGLRRMNWKVTISQLGVTLVMSILRAWVRRGLAKRPYVQLLPPAHEIDWLATRIAQDEHQLWRESQPTAPSFWHRTWDRICGRPPVYKQRIGGPFWTLDCIEWGIVTGQDISGYEPLTGDRQGERTKGAHKVMEARKELGWLTQWPGPASDNAISVATAIEVIMNTLFDSAGDNEVLFWSMNAPRNELIQFEVKRYGGKWIADVAEIEAALSLWLYAVRVSEQATYESHDSNDKSAWLRSGKASKGQGLRLLGRSTRSSRRDMTWWMGGGISRVLQVEVSTEVNGAAIDGVDAITIESHRIVGSRDQPQTPDQRSSPSQKPKSQTYRIQQFPQDSTSSPPSQGEVDITSAAPTTTEEAGSGGTQPSLASVTDVPLGLLFAQDMFSAFVWAVAKAIDRQTVERVMVQTVVQQTNRITSDNSTAWQSFTLQNPTLSRMVQAVQRTGLGSMDDIYMSIIPPLSAENRLPDAGAVAEWAQEEARKHESAGHWDKAGEVLGWAFRACMAFGPDSTVTIKAIVGLTEFIRVTSITAERARMERHTVDTNLEKLREGLSSELVKFVGHSILTKLASIYEMQGRVEGCGQWKPSVQETTVNTSTNSRFFDRVPLRDAILDNSVGEYQMLIERGRFLNDKDLLGWTPLHYAVRQQDRSAVSKLLEAQANPNPKDHAGWTPLHYASWARDTGPRIGQLLLRYNADVDIQGRDGFTPLHCAVSSDNVGLAEILIKRARLEVFDDARRTPLHWAACSGSVGIVGLLLKQQADMDLLDGYGKTPIQLAASRGHDAVVKALAEAEAGMDDERKNRVGRTGLHVVAHRGYVFLVEELLRAGVDVGAKDQDGWTALHEAARSGREAVVKVLLEAGVDMELKCRDGRTALHRAAEEGHLAVVQMLLDAGGEKEVRDNERWTVLRHAVDRGHPKVVQVLLDAGAEIEVRSDDGCTPLHVAAFLGYDEVTKSLVEVGANIEAKTVREGLTMIGCAAWKNHKGVVKILLDAGADTEARGYEGLSPLMLAARSIDDGEMLDILLQGGADINARQSGDNSTALIKASELGHYENMKVLLKAGADVNLAMDKGGTALHCSARRGQTTSVRMLLERGADAGLENQQGETALMVGGGEGVRKLILEALGRK